MRLNSFNIVPFHSWPVCRILYSSCNSISVSTFFTSIFVFFMKKKELKLGHVFLHKIGCSSSRLYDSVCYGAVPISVSLEGFWISSSQNTKYWFTDLPKIGFIWISSACQQTPFLTLSLTQNDLIFTTFYTQWPIFFQNFNVKNFKNCQLKMAYFQSHLTQFTPNDTLFWEVHTKKGHFFQIPGFRSHTL